MHKKGFSFVGAVEFCSGGNLFLSSIKMLLSSTVKVPVLQGVNCTALSWQIDVIVVIVALFCDCFYRLVLVKRVLAALDYCETYGPSTYYTNFFQ